MVANAVIGALRVNLGLDTAAFEKGTKRARSKAAAFGKALATGIAAAAVAAAAALTALTLGLSKFIDKADKISKASQSIGIAVEELSALAHAADLSGVGLDSLIGSVGKLSKSMADSLRSASSEQALAFNALGVSVQDAEGNLRSSSDVMDDLANKFSQMEDGAGKTALALAIFGRSGKDLIPLLNAGALGIAEMKKEAEELGLVISTKTAQASERFNDNMNRLGLISTGFTNALSERMLPALEQLSIVMLDAGKRTLKWAEQFGVLDVAADVLIFTLRGLATAAVVIGALFKGVAISISSVAQSFLLVARGEFALAISAIQNGFSDLADTADQTAETVKQIWKDAAAVIEGDAPETSRKLAAPVVMANEKIKKSLKQTGGALQDFGGFFEGQLTGVFDSFVDGTFNARKALGNLARDLAKFIANRAIRQIFSSLIGGGNSTGGGLSFGGAFAEGGTPPAGKLSLVGENGPELVRGDGRTSVMPLADMGGGGPQIIQQIDARGANANSVAALQSLAADIERRSIEGAIRAVESKRSRTPGMLRGRG